MKLIIIAAVSENGCIGRSGKIPWHFSEDLKHFKIVTTGHTIVMGRNTFESIGSKPLPKRKNIVLSSSLFTSLHNDVMQINKFEDILKLDGDIYICGGERLYREALPVAREIIITHIPGAYEGDTFFPVWPLGSSWRENSCIFGNNGIVYKNYERENNV